MNLCDKQTLVTMLSFVYQTMKASAPLLEFALARTQEPVLRAYYQKHHDEEIGHDDMVLNDLISLGCAEIRPSHLAAQFAGSQYYLIAHEHPSLLLGYMLALESDCMDIADIEHIESAHGVKLTAMRHHTLHDPQHKKDLFEVIRAMPESLQKRISWNEICIKDMMNRVEKEILNG
jgi:hypothetical protein